MTAMLPALKKAARKGRDGDTMIAHINEAEAAALRAMGGSGTRNPRTGLLEFKYGADTNEGGAHGFSGGGSGKGTAGGNGGLGGGSAQKNNFPGYRGPIGTSNPDTSSAGVDNIGGGRVDTGRDTSWGTRIFEDWSGNPITQGMQVARSPAWKQQAEDYNKAARQWNDDLVQNNILGFALPFGMQNVAPRWDQPSTYAGGTYHFGFNPAAAVGGVAGLFAGPAGPVLGPALGKGYSMSGGKNVVLSGPGAPDTGFTGGPKQGSSFSSGASGQSGADGQGQGRTENGGSGGQLSGALLPPIIGNAAATTPPASTGVALPPVSAPTIYQGGYYGVPGPTPYGWARPTWAA